MSVRYNANKARFYAGLADRYGLAALEFDQCADDMSAAESEIVRGEALRLYKLAEQYRRDADEYEKLALQWGWHEGLAQ